MTKSKKTSSDNLHIVGGRNVSPDMPDLADLYTMAYKTLSGLPEKFKPFTKNILVRVENYAGHETLENLNLSDKNDLLGLYRGIPLPLKGSPTNAKLPDIIFLFRCPLIKYAKDNQEPIDQLVHNVMLHEIGHHFGYDDVDAEWISKG